MILVKIVEIYDHYLRNRRYKIRKRKVIEYIVLSRKNVKLLLGVRLRDFDHVGSGKFENENPLLAKIKTNFVRISPPGVVNFSVKSVEVKT